MCCCWCGGPPRAQTDDSCLHAVWNEPSAGVAVTALDPASPSRQPEPAVVASVETGSIGEELGFEPGDQLLSINGVRPRDLIDYRYLIVEEELTLAYNNEGKYCFK